MDDATKLEAIVGDIESEHRAWLDLIAGLDGERATQRSHGGWSPVDALVHVTAWKENGARVARLQAEPDAPLPRPDQGSASLLGIDVDAFNAETLAVSKGSTDEALAEAERVHDDLLEALAALPIDRILVPGSRGRHGSARWLGLTSMSHPAEHRHEQERALVGS